ncbi:MAG: cell division topological specificity factor [Myxococcota bacterium]|jgi:cell division topological specificity factor
MRAFLQRVLGGKQGSKNEAKQRLKVLLIHDQVNLTQAQMEQMREEVVAVIRKYVEIDDSGVDFKLDRGESGVELAASVPVRRVHARAI